jgi:hypothetical protein
MTAVIVFEISSTSSIVRRHGGSLSSASRWRVQLRRGTAGQAIRRQRVSSDRGQRALQLLE